MSTTSPEAPVPASETPTKTPAQGVDVGQIVFAGVLGVAGAYVVLDATTLNIGFADPVGPRLFPYVIGSVLIVLSVVWIVATLRGDRAEPEEGEDVDLDQKADFALVGKLAAVLVANVLLVDVLGWAVTGGLLFAGAAWALGSRTLVRDLLVGVALAVLSWYFFYVALGVPLSPGILDGIL
jgi:putative tricarboxylic transport membrane protein